MGIDRYTRVTVDDETHTIEEWVKFHPERKLTVSAVLARLKKGMTQAEAVTVPRLWSHSRADNNALRAKEDLESFIVKKPEVEPEYEWRFVPYTSHSGEWKKVKVN